MSDHYCCKTCGRRYDDCVCGVTAARRVEPGSLHQSGPFKLQPKPPVKLGNVKKTFNLELSHDDVVSIICEYVKRTYDVPAKFDDVSIRVHIQDVREGLGGPHDTQPDGIEVVYIITELN